MHSAENNPAPFFCSWIHQFATLPSTSQNEPASFSLSDLRTSWRHDYLSGAAPSGKPASEGWRRANKKNREFAMNRCIGDEIVNSCTKLHGELYNNIIKGEHEKSKCYIVTFRYKRRGFQRYLLDNQRQSGGSITFCSLFLSKQTITSLHLF